MSGTSEGDIEEWLASKCFMQRDKAAQIASQLKEELWISNVNGLRLSLEENPTLLLQLNLPSHIVSTVKASLIKRLKDLSIAEVKIILRNMFPDEPDYINRFEQSKITGIVLCFNSSPSKLQEWGINSNIHAEVLQNCLEEWKKEGVPRLMLRDEDKQTSTSSINESLPDKVSTYIVTLLLFYFLLNGLLQNLRRLSSQPTVQSLLVKIL